MKNKLLYNSNGDGVTTSQEEGDLMEGQEEAGVLGSTGSEWAGCGPIALEATEGPFMGHFAHLPPVNVKSWFKEGVLCGREQGCAVG